MRLIRLIFIFLILGSTKIHAVQKELNFHYLFPIPTSHSFMAFTIQQLRDNFDKALLKIKETGEFEAVYDAYLPK